MISPMKMNETFFFSRNTSVSQSSNEDFSFVHLSDAVSMLYEVCSYYISFAPFKTFS